MTLRSSALPALGAALLLIAVAMPPAAADEYVSMAFEGFGRALRNPISFEPREHKLIEAVPI